ncbi:MAG: putative immunity protein [Rhodococcus sp. (in: high G+C Gram-positive bacteria)]
MILPTVRDPRLITVHRGGLLSDDDHRSLALWAAECAEHVLGLFEGAERLDSRPRDAIDATRAWVRGELPMMATRALGGHSMGAARPLRGAARFAAYAAGQAACVAHVPEHDLGAAAYAIKAVRAAAPTGTEAVAAREELDWQRGRLPSSVRKLVLEDQKRRNNICWFVFDD